MKTIWKWLNCKVKLFGQALCYLNVECSFDPPNSTQIVWPLSTQSQLHNSCSRIKAYQISSKCNNLNKSHSTLSLEKNGHRMTAKNLIGSDMGQNERKGQEDYNQQAVIIVDHNYYFYCKCDFVAIMMITTKTFILNRR